MGLEASAIYAIASIATSAIGTGVAVYSQNQQQKTADRIAANNNKLAENEARNRELESMEAISRERRRKRSQMARVRNQLAAGGTLTTSGTPLAILGESNANAEIGINDALRAANMDAASAYSAGQMELWTGKQQAKAYNTAAIGSAIEGVGSIAASSYQTYQTRGPSKAAKA